MVSQYLIVFTAGDWYRPDELYPTCTVLVGVLYNYYLEPIQEMLVGESSPVVCGCLGGTYPRFVLM